MARPMGEEIVTILRAPLLVDARANSSWRNWKQATRTVVRKCVVQPYSSAERTLEYNRDREFARSAVRMYFPAGTDIQPSDRLEWNGAVFEVYGHSAHWSFFNREQHVAVIAYQRTG